MKAALQNAVSEVMASGWYILGPQVAAFEKEFAIYCGVDHCIGVANGTDALELALRALGCGAGSDVVTVANAGAYATTAALALGARPVLSDIDPRTMTMSPESLAKALTPQTKAIVITHLYGQLAEMEELLALARRHHIPVVEDCAQAHGAERAGKRAGSFGTIGCFSFYPTKNLGAIGDGGAVVTHDDRLAGSLRALRQYGWTRKYSAAMPYGRNSRLDEIQAAALRVKLPYLDECNVRRRQIAARFKQAASASIGLPNTSSADHAAHLCVARTRSRSQLATWLCQHAIATEIHYPTPDHLQPALAGLLHVPAQLPATEATAAEILTIPCFPELSEGEIMRICDALARFDDRDTKTEGARDDG